MSLLQNAQFRKRQIQKTVTFCTFSSGVVVEREGHLFCCWLMGFKRWSPAQSDIYFIILERRHSCLKIICKDCALSHVVWLMCCLDALYWSKKLNFFFFFCWMTLQNKCGGFIEINEGTVSEHCLFCFFLWSDPGRMFHCAVWRQLYVQSKGVCYSRLWVWSWMLMCVNQGCSCALDPCLWASAIANCWTCSRIWRW